MNDVYKIKNGRWHGSEIYTAAFVTANQNNTFRDVIDSLTEGVIITDKQGKFLYFNRIAEKILGKGFAEIQPSEWSFYYGCYYSDRVTRFPSERLPLARALQEGIVCNELLFIKNSARPEGIYIDVTANPIFDHRGKINGGSAIFRDVTTQKLSEIELLMQKQRAHALFNGFPIPTYVWRYQDDDFILIDFNYQADQFTTGHIRSLLHTKLSHLYADDPDIQNDFFRCLHEKQIVHREMEYKMKTSGVVKTLGVTYLFVEPDMIMVYTEDLTESKKSEGMIRKLSNAVEQTADSIVIANDKGIIEYVNPAFEKTTGYSRSEAIGKTPGILKSGKHDRTFYQNLWSTLNSGVPFRGTIINKKKNGELFWCEQTITPMKDESSTITNFVSVMKDITKLREQQEQNFRLQLAHEIQESLYKPDIRVTGYDIAGNLIAADRTSGDYYDFVRFADGSIGLIVGDVCGHGIGSALIMEQTRAFLRAFAKYESEPDKILKLLNRELSADLDDYHYVTLIVVRLDSKKAFMDYASAGHVPCYILNGSGELAYTLTSTGVPLGFQDSSEYNKSEPIQLNKDDLIFLLSDGITEAQNNSEMEFGNDKLIDFIRDHRHKSSKEVLQLVFDGVMAFIGNQPQQDDITGIVSKITHNTKH